MKLNNSTSEIFIPDGIEDENALNRTTHLAIGAHHDDLEIFGIDGILQSFGDKMKWFCGVTVTNGSGSPRSGKFKEYTDEQMMEIRKEEQKKAAEIGKYGSQLLLDYPSKEVKDPENRNVIEDIKNIIIETRPKIIYTHNIADKHTTHVAVALKVIEALRELPMEMYPDALYGVEVWRDLDWLSEEHKIVLDASENIELQQKLLEVYESQIAGGKRYDLATMGRRKAHATYHESHETDSLEGAVYAMNLKPLLYVKDLSIDVFIMGIIDDFSREVLKKVQSVS